MQMFCMVLTWVVGKARVNIDRQGTRYKKRVPMGITRGSIDKGEHSGFSKKTGGVCIPIQQDLLAICILDRSSMN